MEILGDGTYDVFILEAEVIDDNTLRLEITVTTGSFKGDVVSIRAANTGRDPLAQVPPVVRHAVLAAEDARFYQHPGVDAGALLRAAYNNIAGRPEQGGSTITQQLAKLNYTNRQRTYFRKVKEILYAAQLERHFSKSELLQRYLNQVYFGEGAYGVSAAARTYFASTADKLDAAQAAMLAGKIRSPEGLNPRKSQVDLEKTKVRRDQVLRNMAKHHWLNRQEVDAAIAEPIA